MAYLSTDDYTLSISLENLNEILDQASQSSGKTADEVRLSAESLAKAFVKSKLKSKYQIDGEFAKNSPDASRDILIVNVVIDLTLCTIHKTINPRDIPELRKLACESAVKWLDEVRAGISLIEVPVVSDGTEEVRTFLGSQQKFISKPYQDASLFDHL
jgi:hypothetical protein